ncbi:hypothetical protein LCGC14_3110660 [marine sediment metagenome]|uniref:Uncharacterized protein n=1 Tax=marine sediment metagenome TaxID=412755 RepID=A0A0F8W5Q2_9ZZZZ
MVWLILILLIFMIILVDMGVNENSDRLDALECAVLEDLKCHK